jgi:hypothetical protein
VKIIRIGILGFGLAMLGLLVLDRVGPNYVPVGIEGTDDSGRPGAAAVPSVDEVSSVERAAGGAEAAPSEEEEAVADDRIATDAPLPVDSPTPEPPDPLPTRGPGEPDPRMVAVRAQLAQLVESEEEDPEWSERMESQIYSELSLLPGFTASLIEVDCRTLHCVVEVTLTRQAATSPATLTTEIDGRRVFVPAPALGLETVALLFLGGANDLPVFVTYLRRGQDSTTQSSSVAASS